MRSLLFRASISLIVLLTVMAAILFVSAGTARYAEGWWYLAAFGLASLLTTIDLMKRDPALLERRMRGGPQAEKETAQKVIMTFASLGFIGMLVVPGLDRRFDWSYVPAYLAWVGIALLLVGFYFIDRVYHANTYTAATIQVEEGQTLISTGPYGIVRHPMYASALLYLLGTPLALRSWWGYAAFGFMLPSLIWRLLHEERFLSRELPGYPEYMNRVRYRLVPGVWVVLLVVAFTACANNDAGRKPQYRPQTRDVTITAVPLLTKELESVYPFLRQSFAQGGVMPDEEVYAFSPSTITVIEGDTIRLHLLNPEDDEHSFVLPGFTVAMRPQSRTDTVYVAGKAGIYQFVCAVPKHLPMMWGQLVVLSARSIGSN